MFGYVISGLSVLSDAMLPGLIALPEPPVLADVHIRAGVVPGELTHPDDHGPNWQIAPGRFLIAVPGIVRMLLSDGKDILYQCEEGVALQDAAVFISGTGFGLLLQQRGSVVLHASAVRVDGSAMLFCGPSGAGKSTMAAALSDAGYDLVTDDLCAVTIDDHGRPWVEPDGRQLKLWQNSIARLDMVSRRTLPVRLKLQKFYVEPRAAAAERLPLGGVYVLRETRPPLSAGIGWPNIVDAALMLRNNAYRPTMVRRMQQQQQYFDVSAAICHRAGVYTLTRPLDFGRLPTVIDWLETHWQSLSLPGKAA